MRWLTRILEVLGLVDRPFRPRPADWKKTLADLDAEKRSLTGEEIEWARDYERELLRGSVRFPKDGERFEALHDVEVSYVVFRKGPGAGGGKGVLPKGSRITVSVPAQDAEPVGVQALAVDEKEIERLLVPENDRSAGSYAGFSLFIPVAQLDKAFQLVEQNGS